MLSILTQTFSNLILPQILPDLVSRDDLTVGLSRRCPFEGVLDEPDAPSYRRAPVKFKPERPGLWVARARFPQTAEPWGWIRGYFLMDAAGHIHATSSPGSFVHYVDAGEWIDVDIDAGLDSLTKGRDHMFLGDPLREVERGQA